MNDFSIIISAPSGAGKTTIISKFLEDDNRFGFSISTTTRNKREGEIEGKDYYFISTDEFKKKIENSEFLEWAEVHGNYYGTLKKEIDRIIGIERIPIFDVDYQGAIQLKENLKRGVFIFIIPPDLEELEKRLRNRKTDSDESIKLRLKNAVKELKKYHIYDYIVINDQIDLAVNKLEAIITAELCKKDQLSHRLNNILEAINDNSNE